jgi:hypothetical protein
MLIVLIISLLFGGPDEPVFDKQTRAAIKQSIDDAARRSTVLDAVKGIEKSKEQLIKAGRKIGKRLVRINKDTGIGVAEAEAALAEITRVRLETQQTFIDGVFENSVFRNRSRRQTTWNDGIVGCWNTGFGKWCAK